MAADAADLVDPQPLDLDQVTSIRGRARVGDEDVGLLRVVPVPLHLPEPLKPAVTPLPENKVLSRQICETEKETEKLSKARYPDTARLRQVGGSEALLPLAFVRCRPTL